LGDYLIGNTDRHQLNYGVIVDSEAQTIKRFAPLFDHGNSYLFGDIGFIDYLPTGRSFNKSIQFLEETTLALSEKINICTIKHAMDETMLTPDEKATICGIIVKRLDTIRELCRERNERDARER